MSLEKAYKEFMRHCPELKVPLLFDQIKKNKENLIHEGVFIPGSSLSRNDTNTSESTGNRYQIKQRKKWTREDFQFKDCFR